MELSVVIISNRRCCSVRSKYVELLCRRQPYRPSKRCHCKNDRNYNESTYRHGMGYCNRGKIKLIIHFHMDLYSCTSLWLRLKRNPNLFNVNFHFRVAGNIYAYVEDKTDKHVTRCLSINILELYFRLISHC